MRIKARPGSGEKRDPLQDQLARAGNQGRFSKACANFPQPRLGMLSGNCRKFTFICPPGCNPRPTDFAPPTPKRAGLREGLRFPADFPLKKGATVGNRCLAARSEACHDAGMRITSLSTTSKEDEQRGKPSPRQDMGEKIPGLNGALELRRRAETF
jgi:hypothetical protein